jgi:hypothetical protein
MLLTVSFLGSCYRIITIRVMKLSKLDSFYDGWRDVDCVEVGSREASLLLRFGEPITHPDERVFFVKISVLEIFKPHTLEGQLCVDG